MLQDSDTIRISDVSEAVIHGILAVVSDGIWDWNANTGFVYRNPGWYQMLGYEPHSLGNNVFTWESVIHPDDMDRVMASFDAYLSGAAPDYRVEYRCRSRAGDYIWIEDCGRVIARNPDGSVARMIGAHRNIHAQKLLLEQLERAIRQECERAKRFHQPFSVIAMDVDDFKQINDNHGHHAGDQTLINIVALVRSHIREIDLIARWGGDEFMVVLPNTGRADGRLVADKLRELLVQSRVCQHFDITMSFGLAEYQPDEPMSQLMVRVDRALYQAKLTGKNQICE